MKQSISFLSQYLRDPSQIGAIAPSSRFLAAALAAPFTKRQHPACVLEVGAGTGVVTRALLRHMADDDVLDICEANPRLISVLESTVLASHRSDNGLGTTRLFGDYLQNIRDLGHYDYIVSGLPFSAFSLKEVRNILGILRGHAKPGCIFSYFEYVGIRSVMKFIRRGSAGRRFRYLSAYLDRQISNMQYDCSPILLNIPPAYARHLQLRAA